MIKESKTSKSVPISIIVPARNCPDLLRTCLTYINHSQYTNFELIVVNDASTDNTADIAIELGAKVINLDKQSGPAKARNRGAEIARGKYVFFIDADVLVYPDTIEKVVTYFESHPDVDALFGSYDVSPAAPNIMSQFKNLFHHFVHQQAREEASTFWSGCGAVKREVFLKMGGFNTNYERPCIEDIELGLRMHKAGYRIVVHKEVQVKHLKMWTLWGMLKADIKDRAIPWTELIMREKELPNDLNLKLSQRISALLSFGVIGAVMIEALNWHELFFLPLGILFLIYLLDYWSIKHRVPNSIRILAVITIAIGIVTIFYFKMIWLIIAFLLTITIILLNYRLYLFFAKEKYWLFAILVIPLHIFYYIYSSLSFVSGILLYLWKSRRKGEAFSGSINT
ncbi:MAG: glycosyltransferase [Calditrichaeota bacterium]|nr:MAG: glycosyltransferase [Calditrichota bacterium]